MGPTNRADQETRAHASFGAIAREFCRMPGGTAIANLVGMPKLFVSSWTVLIPLVLAAACGAEAGDEVGPGGSDASHDSASEGDLPDAGELDQSVSDAPADAVEDDAPPPDAADAEPDQASGDAGADAGACATQETLLDLSGQTFTPTSAVGSEKHAFGKKGTAYCALRIELDLHSGDLQPVETDAGMTRIEHIFFGLARANQTQSAQRYLMGTAAVRFTNKQPSYKMYGRIALAQGYQSYTSWQATYAWKTDTDYHIDCTFDAAGKQQRCKLLSNGVLLKEVVGAIGYIDVAAHMSSAFQLELGSPPGGPELTTPFGWQFSNVRVTATRP